MFSRSIYRTSILLTLLAILALTSDKAVSAQLAVGQAGVQAAISDPHTAYGTSPVMFAENVGQGPSVTPSASPWDFASQDLNSYPAARADSAFAFDGGLYRYLLFGGWLPSGFANDTWVYDQTGWHQLVPAHSPGARQNEGNAMAYDVARQRVVLFGGLGGGELGDTWEYYANDWHQVTPAGSPGVRNSFGMVYRSAGAKVVLFGGWHPSAHLLNDTWEYDGSTWTPVNTAHKPSPRRNFGIAYDSRRNRIVVFGGCTAWGCAATVNDTWEYDGTDWHQVSTPTAPEARAYHGMVYDAARQKTVMFGGCSLLQDFHTCIGTVFNDTWEYDGISWTRLSVPRSPSPRYEHMMGYDTARATAMLFGGRQTVNSFLGDTWIWNGSTWDEAGLGGSTISGRVTDASGTGIPGVTVWAGFPRNTTTDASGKYTFTGLPEGTYTIRPDKEPCTFSPTTQTVTIPPGKVLPDFTSVRLASGLDVCILEPGDILLKAGAPVGDYTDLIRFWIKLGGSYFTHSALYLGITSDPQNPAQSGPRIAEAAGKKKLGGSREDEVWETWLADTQWWDGENVTDWAVVRPVASSEAKAIALQYARDKATDPDVVFSFLTDLDDEQEFYCSKLVWKSYQRAGLDVHKKTGLTGDLTSYWVTPEDLYFGSPVVQNMPGVDPSARAFFRKYSPAHITLIDPLGRRTGFDATSGGEVNEIPGALYSGADAQIESITVAGLESPEGWRLLATGYAAGTYTLETGYLDDRTRNWVTHATTSEGTIDEYPVRPPNYPSYLPLLLR